MEYTLYAITSDGLKYAGTEHSLDSARVSAINYLKGIKTNRKVIVANSNDVTSGYITKAKGSDGKWVVMWRTTKDKKFRAINRNGTLGDYIPTSIVKDLISESTMKYAKKSSKKKNIPEYIEYGKYMAKGKGMYEKVYGKW